MSDPKDKLTDEPRRLNSPEMDLEPIPLPDRSGENPLDNGDERLDEGRVKPVPSDKANMGPATYLIVRT